MENTIKPFDIVHDETGYRLGDGREIKIIRENYHDAAWKLLDRLKLLVDMAKFDTSIDDILDLVSTIVRDGQKTLDELDTAEKDFCGHIMILRVQENQPGGYDDQIIAAEFYDRDDNLVYPLQAQSSPRFSDSDILDRIFDESGKEVVCDA